MEKLDKATNFKGIIDNCDILDVKVLTFHSMNEDEECFEKDEEEHLLKDFHL